jgi:rhamnose utilization protein RhaD (predicted bifunctional aldolase and dehydrogenase)
MQSRWDDSEAPSDPLEQLVYSSRLIGREPSLVLWGGGNTSLKGTAADHRGRPVDVMFIKASGADLKDADRRYYPPVRMEDVLAARERDDMDIREMVAYVTRALLEPGAPRPSIETLLHGPHGRPGGPPPGRGRLRARPPRAGDVGATCRESYERHVELVARAEAYVAARRRPIAVPPALDAGAREAAVAEVGPVLRGLLFRATPTASRRASWRSTTVGGRCSAGR